MTTGTESGPVRLSLPAAAAAGALPSLDTSVNIALPAISAAFGLAVGDVAWVVVGYVLTYAALLLGCGRLADRLGHHRVLLSGLLLSTLAFGLCAGAPTFPLLVAARVVQGAGAGLVLAAAPALVTLSVPPAEQGRALGFFQGCVWTAFAVGPPLGGLVLGPWGWPAVWWYRVAVGLALLAWVGLAARLFAGGRRGERRPTGRRGERRPTGRRGERRPTGRGGESESPARAAAAVPTGRGGEPEPPGRADAVVPPGRVRAAVAPGRAAATAPPDLAGAGTLALALVGLLLAASRGRALGWTSPLVLAAVGVGAAAAVAFVVIERRAAAPVVDLSLFARPGFALANGLNLAANASGFVILLLVPYYLVDVRGLGPVAGGLVLASAPLGTAGCALVSGRLVGRVGVGRLSALGLALEAVGLAAVSQLGAGSAMASVVAALALAGIGLGLFQVPNQSFVMGSIPRAAQGVAGGMTQAVRTIGVLVGVAGGGTLLESRQRTHAGRMAVGVDDPAAFLAAFADVFVAAAATAAVAATAAFVRRRVARA